MLGKIMVTVILIGLAFLAARVLRDTGRKRRDSIEDTARKTTERYSKSQGIENDKAGYEPMLQCPTCKAYLPESKLKQCGRDDCPAPDR